MNESKNSSSKPTQTHRDLFGLAKKGFATLLPKINGLISNKLEPLRKEIQEAGAPYTPNRVLELIR